MPMLVVKNSENLMHHDASLVVWYEPKKPVAEMNTAIAYERLGELIHYRIDRIEESRIYEDVTKFRAEHP